MKPNAPAPLAAPDTTFEEVFCIRSESLEFYGHKLVPAAVCNIRDERMALELKLVSLAEGGPRWLTMDAYDCLMVTAVSREWAWQLDTSKLETPAFVMFDQVGPCAVLSLTHKHTSGGKVRWRVDNYGVEIERRAEGIHRLHFCEGTGAVQLDAMVVDLTFHEFRGLRPDELPSRGADKVPRVRDWPDPDYPGYVNG